MRSNWTSQPTSCTSTFTPVLAVKGATIFSQVLLRLGRVGHRPQRQRHALLRAGRPRRPWPRRLGGIATAVVAATGDDGRGGKHERDRRRDDRKPLGHGYSSSVGCYKNGFGTARKNDGPCGRVEPPTLGAVEPRTTSSTGSVRSRGRSGSPAMRATRASPAAAPRPSLSWRSVVRGGLTWGASWMSSKPTIAQVLGHGRARPRRAARIAPMAIRSDAAKIAVGRLRRASSRRSVASRPGLGVEVAVAHVVVAVGEAERLDRGAVAAQAVDARARVDHAR